LKEFAAAGGIQLKPATQAKQLGIDQLEPIHIDQTAIGDLQVRDDGQRQESELKEGLGQRAAHCSYRVA
jgi:hypothetical protein